MLTDRKGEPTDVSKANSQGYLNMFLLSIIDYKYVSTSLLDKKNKLNEAIIVLVLSGGSFLIISLGVLLAEYSVAKTS